MLNIWKLEDNTSILMILLQIWGEDDYAEIATRYTLLKEVEQLLI